MHRRVPEGLANADRDWSPAGGNFAEAATAADVRRRQASQAATAPVLNDDTPSDRDGNTEDAVVTLAPAESDTERRDVL